METRNIEGAPAAIGPYSHAVRAAGLVFCSGQTPVDPKTGKLVGKTIEEQTTRVLQNISIVLGGLGLSLQNVVKTTVFLRSMDDFAGMNGVYAAALAPNAPARSTISIRANPLDALVEIECIAEDRPA